MFLFLESKDNELQVYSRIVKSESDKNQLPWKLLYAFFSLGYLTVRELIQISISDSKLGYFKKKSNLLELALIIASFTFMLSKIFYREAATIIMLIMSIEILMLIPSYTWNTYTYMMKTVIERIVQLFTTIMDIIIHLSIAFYLLFRPIIKRSYGFDEFGNYTVVNETMEQCNRPENKNFGGYINSLLKTTTMFAGYVEMEPHNLISHWKKIFFFAFLITSLIMLNLINGLAISDIQAGLLSLVNLIK